MGGVHRGCAPGSSVAIRDSGGCREAADEEVGESRGAGGRRICGCKKEPSNISARDVSEKKRVSRGEKNILEPCIDVSAGQWV